MCVRAYECMHALLATALYFIQVDSKFMLPAPLESYCKKSQMKGCSNSNVLQMYGHCFLFASWDGNAKEMMLYAE